jgi:hypothetical protein
MVLIWQLAPPADELTAGLFWSERCMSCMICVLLLATSFGEIPERHNACCSGNRYVAAYSRECTHLTQL